MDKNIIIIIDDDKDDSEMITQAFKEINAENEIITFNKSDDFLEYMRTNNPKIFFILCDINMPLINGLELKKLIHDDEELRMKCVPFIFLSTTGASSSIMKAYSYGVQGYFIKPPSFKELKVRLQSIMFYWSGSQHPNI